jgi:hypothetical protein
MPTWCMNRRVFDAVGGFVESAPEDGEAGARILHPSTFLLDVSCFCGMRWVFSMDFQRKFGSGRAEK